MSNPEISNNIIVQNETYAGGGGISAVDANPIIVNNTVTRNIARMVAGAIMVCEYSDALIINTVCSEDTAWQGYNEIGIFFLSSAMILYCNIADTLWPGEGNISVDPLFRNPRNGDFHPMSTACGDPFDSPCIDAGDPSIFDYLLDCDWGLGGERSDMGAYGGQAIPTDIREEPGPEIPTACGLLQNYPNPFNATTTLSYMLPRAGAVKISVYNLLGQRVETVLEEDQQAGSHNLVWDASDLPSGVYFARLEIEERWQTVKMMLLK